MNTKELSHIEAMQKAIDAIEAYLSASNDEEDNDAHENLCDAWAALREALAEQQAPVQKRPQNCGTGHCSCIECPYEQPAPQAVQTAQQEPCTQCKGAGMITTREQYELAAKAAGLSITWKEGHCKGGDFEAAFVGDQPWRPKDDDGDALRLAVKLNIAIRPNARGSQSPAAFVCYNKADDFGMIPTDFHLYIIHNDDPNAATRLAIVRAAAEIGRAME